MRFASVLIIDPILYLSQILKVEMRVTIALKISLLLLQPLVVVSFFSGRSLRGSSNNSSETRQCSAVASMEALQDSKKATLLQPLVVCGPSGVGKGTIIEKYMTEFGGMDRFGFTVSHTTRDPRPGEVHGVHYHFTSKETMQAQITEGGYFLEHAQVHGNYYGTSWSSLRDVQDGGKHCLLDIDVQGVKQLKRLQESPEFKPKYLFIAPPSLEILQERLSRRGTESAESLQRRTANAKAEVEYGLQEGNFDVIVVNNDLDKACRDFDAAIKTLYELN